MNRELSEAYAKDAQTYAEKARLAKTHKSRRYWQREAIRADREAERLRESRP